MNVAEISTKYLESKPYRKLQQMAKSMGLPSNFKKIYLLELITAKKYQSDIEVNKIIDRVREERLHKSKDKKKSQIMKMKVQFKSSAQRISEPRSSIVSSPHPIESSPKILRKALVPINPKRNLLCEITNSQNTNNSTAISISSSDRVLRSYNLKTLKPNYALLNNSIPESTTECCTSTERKYKFISNNRFPQFNTVRAKCFMRKNRNMFGNVTRPISKPQVMIANRDLIQNALPSRQRTVSGIYPIQPKEIVPRNLATNQSVCLRKADGSCTKISALVQKCNTSLLKKSNYAIKSPQTNVQEVTENNIPEDLTKENNNYLETQYPNTAAIPSNVNGQITMKHKENYSQTDTQSVLEYEKRLIMEQLRYQRIRSVEQPQLPNINDAFSRFSRMHQRDPTQPLYVQVDTEVDSVPDRPIYVNRSTGSTLECLYNVRTSTSFVLTKPAQTISVYTTKTTPTVRALLPSTAAPDAAFSVPSLRPDEYQYNFDSDLRLQDFLQMQPDIRRNGEQNTDMSSSSSMDTMYTSASAPETTDTMVDDALEIISQDGDYMEQMGLNQQLQCVLCSWAGPKILLESHIRKEHADFIHAHRKSEWNITYSLESLVECREWLRTLVEYDSALYVLSAKYEDPGCFMATLASLSTEPEPTEKTVSITLYNKITGEPFTWADQIPSLPPLPYDNNAKCLKIDLCKLDLLPNSANLKLVNRELVTQSPSKAVVGQPSLNDIHIILFIKIYN